jgi:hypothetical protein
MGDRGGLRGEGGGGGGGPPPRWGGAGGGWGGVWGGGGGGAPHSLPPLVVFVPVVFVPVVLVPVVIVPDQRCWPANRVDVLGAGRPRSFRKVGPGRFP